MSLAKKNSSQPLHFMDFPKVYKYFTLNLHAHRLNKEG